MAKYLRETDSWYIQNNHALQDLEKGIEKKIGACAVADSEIVKYDALFRQYVEMQSSHSDTQFYGFINEAEGVAAFDLCAAFIMASCVETNEVLGKDEREELNALINSFAGRVASDPAKALRNPEEIAGFYSICFAQAFRGHWPLPHLREPLVKAMEDVSKAGLRPSESFRAAAYDEVSRSKVDPKFPRAAAELDLRLQRLFQP